VILAIETSCDDTCVAVVTAAGEVRSNVIASQGLLHSRYGGVVPEIASRRHLELLDAVTADALEQAGVGLDEIEKVAVTHGPGLIGALLVGLSAAKALAAARGLPLVAVDHLHGHVVAPTLLPDPIEPPYVCLVASGGHTFLARVDEAGSYSILGQTLDDAAGEAFDKGARLLGLGYPGGPAIDRLAREGDPEAFDFPRSLPSGPSADRAGGAQPERRSGEHRTDAGGGAQRERRSGEHRTDALHFSFSGVKTSLLYRVRDLGEKETTRRRADLAASYQAAIVAALTARLRQALEREGVERAALGGGVAANSQLRREAQELCDEVGVRLWTPAMELCTDNAAMIAAAARFGEPLPYPDYLSLDASARLKPKVPA
jgi:N6-L-threonylcarbamoyladenine synthase